MRGLWAGVRVPVPYSSHWPGTPWQSDSVVHPSLMMLRDVEFSFQFCRKAGFPRNKLPSRLEGLKMPDGGLRCPGAQCQTPGGRPRLTNLHADPRKDARGSGPERHGSICNRFCRRLETNPSESMKRKKRGEDVLAAVWGREGGPWRVRAEWRSDD